MKKIAVMASGNGSNFEAIVNYFKDKNIEITCVSDVLNAPVLERAERLGIKHKYLPFEENAQYFASQKFDLIVLAGYMRILPPKVLELGRFINIHPSLLPAFKGKDAIRRAFMSGVKVSGITIHWVTDELDGGKIITQYPVLIGNGTHFDEFEDEIHKIEHMVYPIVIEKILEDKVFDFTDLFPSGGCSGGCSSKEGGCSGKEDGCGGCGGCH